MAWNGTPNDEERFRERQRELLREFYAQTTPEREDRDRVVRECTERIEKAKREFCDRTDDRWQAMRRRLTEEFGPKAVIGVRQGR